MDSSCSLLVHCKSVFIRLLYEKVGNVGCTIDAEKNHKQAVCIDGFVLESCKTFGDLEK